MLRIGEKFSTAPEEAWDMYLDLGDWELREEVAKELLRCQNNAGFSAFTGKYRQKMEQYIRDEFYDDVLFNREQMKILAHQYQFKGNVEVPFLKGTALGKLSKFICYSIIFNYTEIFLNTRSCETF